MTRVLILLLLLSVSGGAALVMLHSRQPPPQQPVAITPVIPRVNVVVAARPIRAGALLQAEDMAALSIPEAGLPAGSSIDSVDVRTAMRGAMVRESIAKDQPITAANVLRPGDRGFLAAVLMPGMRATSVAVDAVSGAAGLIWPGDHIDLVLTQVIDDAAKPPGKRVVGELVQRDVRVIAVDQQLVEGGQQSVLPAGSPVTNRVLTLEVSSSGAARIAVASRLGRLTALVRSAREAPSPTTSSSAVWADDVSPAIRSPDQNANSELRLFRASPDPTRVRF